MRTRNAAPLRPERQIRGISSGLRAGPRGLTLRDGVNEAHPVIDVLFQGATVTELDDDTALVIIGGTGSGGPGGGPGTGGGGDPGTSTGAIIFMLNNSAQDLLPGDGVVVDETADRAVTVTTTEGDNRIQGIVQEPIPSGASGPVLFPGAYAAEVNVVGARGEYIKTSTTAAVLTTTTDREAGSFGVLLTGATIGAEFATAEQTTILEVPAESVAIGMPSPLPVNRALFLALWLEDAAASVDVDGWTLIGSESGFYYYTRVSEGDDEATAEWTTASVAVATVIVMPESVSLAIPVEAHDYDTSGSAATVGGLSDVPRYALAGVQADVATPGSGFVRLGGGSVPGLGLSAGSITTVTDDSKYNAWPVICRLQTGDLLMAYTKADTHHQDNTGKVVGKISSNEGVSWGSEFTIYDHASLWAGTVGVTTLSSGRVICTLFRDNAGASGTGEAGIVYSDDDGGTWSSWVALTNGFTQEAFGAGPVVELPGGDLIVTIEGSNTGTAAINRSSHLLRSTDDGLTWGSEVTIRDYATDLRPYYETCLLLLASGDLIAVHRTSAITGTCYVSRSTNDGLTWGIPYAAFPGYGQPHTIQTASGMLISTNRRNSDAAVIGTASFDDGFTWTDVVELASGMFESEYACPIETTTPGTTLVIFGTQPTSATTNSDIKQIDITEDPFTLAGTLAGKYIGHDASATSPFSGGGQAMDAIFAINLLGDAMPSALLYGPDLGVGGGAPGLVSEPLILEDGTIAILENGRPAMSELM